MLNNSLLSAYRLKLWLWTWTWHLEIQGKVASTDPKHWLSLGCLQGLCLNKDTRFNWIFKSIEATGRCLGVTWWSPEEGSAKCKGTGEMHRRDARKSWANPKRVWETEDLGVGERTKTAQERGWQMAPQGGAGGPSLIEVDGDREEIHHHSEVL